MDGMGTMLKVADQIVPSGEPAQREWYFRSLSSPNPLAGRAFVSERQFAPYD